MTPIDFTRGIESELRKEEFAAPYIDWLIDQGRIKEAEKFRYICCRKCFSWPKDQEVRNFSRMLGDGDVYCLKCGSYVRMFDSG